MAKSIRSKWKRKCRAVKRVRYGAKELARLKKTLGIDENNTDVDMSSIQKVAKVVSKNDIRDSVIDTSNSMDVDNKRIFNPKTMRDQHGAYPVWMNKRRIRKSKKVEKKKKTKKKR
ncbi:protein llp [Holotrichia oblita]|uniref:Protein llp n=4 Tax=Holotrichia oblita TaxID=644536 RepID=A0ACB9SVM2_HOLOL|nr:protein llp [Holotrichia oblita]KAI4458596.1 protein llp [Holotrichia oblita]KAI4458608.1 protein llp [Holotrichia oblita]KAI4458617.1 protein llp [Holotrichia oblita]